MSVTLTSRLAQKHLRDLYASGLSDATIAAAGLHTLRDPSEVGTLLRWNGPARALGECLAFPFRKPTGEFNGFVRVKPDRPRTKGERLVKYESPAGEPNRAYFPPGVVDVLDDVSVPLGLTEGEKKSLKASQEGFPTIGLTGVDSWSKKRPKGADGKPAGPRELIDDLAAIAWSGRTVFIVFDSDAAEKDGVKWAEWHLAKALEAKGATVKVARLPSGADGRKAGLDDYLLGHSADDLRALMAAAGPPSRPNGRNAGGDLFGADEHLTDVGNARRLVARHGRDLRFCHPWGKWLVWDATRWRVDDTAAVERMAKETVRALYAEAAGEADPDKRAALAKHAAKSEGRERIRAMMALAASEDGVPVLPSELDRDPWLLNCPNGAVELRTGRLRPHRREDLLTKLCPTPYDPDAACPLFERFLATIFPASGDACEQPGDALMVGFVRRLLGRCLTGDVSEQVLAVFHGGGANGKTSLLNVVKTVMGEEYATAAPPELLMARRGEHHPTEQVVLYGKRLVVAMESQEGGRLNEALVKQLTGGDAISARRMREDWWEFKPTHKLILSTNHKPKVTGTDHALWRRLRLVPFAVTFWDPSTAAKPGESRPLALRADKTLTGRLLAEAPGVLTWLAGGCREWLAQGLGEPPAVAEATEGYRESQDLIGTFLAERCTDTGDMRASDLYAAFSRWCESVGERFTPSYREFGTAMTERGYERYTSNGTRYRGLSLNDPFTEPTEPNGT